MYRKNRLRRSMMFVPGNNPGMIRDAHIYGADSIMFDLEDSVAYTEKDAARLLVYNALKTLHFGTKETVVRINDLSSGLGVQDLEAVVRAGVQVVRLPKTDCAQDVIDCEREIARIERESGIPVGTTGMMAAIESANGVLNAAEIAAIIRFMIQSSFLNTKIIKTLRQRASFPLPQPFSCVMAHLRRMLL